MKKKRIVKTSLSLLLALTMVLGTATTVFAEEENIAGMSEAQESVETADTTTETAIAAVDNAEESVGNTGITLVITEVTADGEKTINLDSVETNLTDAKTDLSNTNTHLTDAEEIANEAKMIIDEAKVESLSIEIENADTALNDADNASLQDKTDAEDGLDTVYNADTSTQAKPGLDKAEVAANDSKTQVEEAEAALKTINNDITVLNKAIIDAKEKKAKAENALEYATDDAEAAQEKLAAAEKEIEDLQAKLGETIENRDKTRSDEIAILEKELKEHCGNWDVSWDKNSDDLSQDEKNGRNAFWNEYWKKMDALSKLYIIKMLEAENEGATIEIDQRYTHPTTAEIDKDGNIVYEDGKIKMNSDESQNYIKVRIKIGENTEERLYNYVMINKRSKEDFSIIVKKKESGTEVDITNEIKGDRYVKMVEDPEDNSKLIEDELSAEKIAEEKENGRVFESTDVDGNPVSITFVGDEIAVPVKEKVTEDVAVKDYKGAKVDESSKVDTYTQGTANVLTGYGTTEEIVKDKGGFLKFDYISNELIERLQRDYADSQYQIKVYTRNFFWQDWEEHDGKLSGIKEFFSWADGVRVEVVQTKEDTNKPQYTEQNCIIKTTTGNVEEEVAPAEKFDETSDTYSFGGLMGRSEDRAKKLAKQDADNLAKKYRAQGYTVVVYDPIIHSGTWETLGKDYYTCSITCTKDRVTTIHENVVLSTEYFNPDTYEFKSKEYGTKTVYSDGEEVISTSSISGELQTAWEKVNAFEQANTDIAAAVTAVQKAKEAVDEALDKVKELKLSASATANEIATAEKALKEAQDKLTEREDALETVRENAADANTAYEEALRIYNELLDKERAADGENDTTDGGDDTTPVAPVNPTTVIEETPVALAAVPVAANNAVVNAADDNDGNGVVVIEDDATPLADSIKATEDDNKQIADEDTPLAAGLEKENNIISWLWLLILLIILATGATVIYIRSKKEKSTVTK